MKNYKEMSDFEINKAVLFLSGVEYEDCDYNPFPEDCTSFSYGDGANWYEFDPCNNPSDAWPIIVENKISLITDETTENWSTGYIIDFSDETAYKYNTQDLKPLRSAMITFLMMKEKEQETQ